MLSVTTPLMSKTRQPASQATPQKPVARPAPSSHSEVHSVIPLHLGSDVADHTTESADQRSLGTLGDCHGETELTADRSHFRADEAGTDDQDPTRLGRQGSL
jgi:hypothetical protein